MPKVSVIIVTYNSEKYLPDFLDSVFNQTYFRQKQIAPDIFVIDNASTDRTVKFIKDTFPTVNLLRNVNNIGLCRAWNQGIQMTSGEYVLIINPDLILDQDFIKQTLKIIEQDQTVGSIGGKLYQLRVRSLDEDGLSNLEKTNIIDTAGIAAQKSRRFYERGSGQIDRGQYSQEEQVFGISGAAVMYRRSVLEQVKFSQEYFDQDFFMYQEDIDMAWRLRLAGYISIYTPKAIGYHHRRARSFLKEKDRHTISRHRRREFFVNYHSYKNHLMLLRKNSLAINILKHLPFILFYE